MMGGKITLAIRRRFGYNSKVSSAGVMELVDVVDSKSTAGDSVPVRVRSPAPSSASVPWNTGRSQYYPGVAQLVARLLWEQDAAGSNPVTRTKLYAA